LSPNGDPENNAHIKELIGYDVLPHDTFEVFMRTWENRQK